MTFAGAEGRSEGRSGSWRGKFKRGSFLLPFGQDFLCYFPLLVLKRIGLATELVFSPGDLSKHEMEI